MSLLELADSPTRANLAFALQRLAGNAALAQAIAAGSGPLYGPASGVPAAPALQRWISGSPTAQSALEAIRKSGILKGYYENWLSLGESDSTIGNLLQGYVENEEKELSLQVVVGIVNKAVVEKHATFAPGPSAALETRVLEVEENFEEGLALSITERKWSLATKEASLKADVAFRVPPAEVGQWELGFIQTVVQANHSEWVRKPPDDYYGVITEVSSPLRDGPKGSEGPWYDPQSKLDLASPEGRVSVKMFDAPELGFWKPAGCEFYGAIGDVEFKAWLAVRKKDGSQIRFLRGWHWSVDWGILPGKRQGKGIQLLDRADSGAGAVLDGRTFGDSLPSKVAYEGAFEEPEKFREWRAAK